MHKRGDLFMRKAVLITFLVLIFAAGCSGLSGNLSQTKVLEVTDSTGHTAVINGLPERIAIAGKATIMVQDAIYLFPDALDKVIALEDRNQSAYSFLPVIDPGLDSKSIFEKNVGPEQIAAVQPDLVIMKSFMAEDLGEPLEQLDIPVVYLDLESPEAFYQDIFTLGQVFGSESRADEIVDYYQEHVSWVEGLVSDVEDSAKPSVLILQYSDKGGEVAFKVPPISWLQTTLVETAGGDPVWKDLEISGGWLVVNLEQIAAWDPDQIYVIDYSGKAEEVIAGLKDNQIWRNFKAVQDDQIFAFAYDFYSWDQPDTRWLLGLEWLVTKIHPDLSAELDIIEEVEDFYHVLYQMDSDAINEHVLPRLIGDIP
jgi:iron complex transport system substrate-binding protein